MQTGQWQEGRPVRTAGHLRTGTFNLRANERRKCSKEGYALIFQRPFRLQAEEGIPGGHFGGSAETKVRDGGSSNRSTGEGQDVIGELGSVGLRVHGM